MLKHGLVLALYQASGGAALEKGLALNKAQGWTLFVAMPQQVLALRHAEAAKCLHT